MISDPRIKYHTLQILCPIILFFFIGCGTISSTATPKVRLEKSRAQTRIPLLIGLDVTNLEGYKHWPTSNITINVGESSVVLFFKGLSNIFEQVNRIDSKSQHDFRLIMVPRIASLTMDRVGSNMFSEPNYCSVVYNVTVLDSGKDTLLDKNFTGTVSRTESTYDGLDLLTLGVFANSILSRAYSRLFSDAAKIAFDKVENALQQLILEIAGYRSLRRDPDSLRKALIRRQEEQIRKEREREEKLALQRRKEEVELEKRTAPSELILEAQFKDESSVIPNKTLDAGEKASISLTITNQGKGIAVYAKLKAETEYKNINLPAPIYIGNIGPGESRKASIKLRAELELTEGTIPLKITCTEKRGYATYTTIDVPAAKLDKPHLILAGYKINDCNTGFTSGNGNGIPENGETVELISSIKNNGIGKAIDVDVHISSETNGVVIKRVNETLTEIMPGKTAKGRLVFILLPTFQGESINLNLKASDVRGVSVCQESIVIKAKSRFPRLVCSYIIRNGNGKIISNEQDGFIENGEKGQLEIRLANKGELEAKDIKIDIYSDTVHILEKHKEIDNIDVQGEAKPQIFTFEIPRTLGSDTARVIINVTQKDFSDLKEIIRIPHRPFTP